MSDTGRPVRTGCSGKSGETAAEAEAYSENLKAAYLDSPVGAGFKEQLDRARRLTPAFGVRKAARVAVAASMLLAGRGPEASS